MSFIERRKVTAVRKEEIEPTPPKKARGNIEREVEGRRRGKQKKRKAKGSGEEKETEKERK